ncbi:MAG: hypothetical protein K1060chlam1_01174 [Candidatus Anoxychlamydiales bacterium]|nr:hypothetical protein [Candidatus Anoxychlamydiales bacterium]
MNSIVKQKKKVQMPILIGALIITLNNIQSKIDVATGAATALELRLRIIAQLEPKMQVELKKQKTNYADASLQDLIDALLKVFQDKLNSGDLHKINNIRYPRNKTSHANFVQLMINLNGEALGREINPRTGKREPLGNKDIIEGAICIDSSQALVKFSQRANKVIEILENKILYSLQP